jgi:CCR4-NOT transcription complex subunit 1
LSARALLESDRAITQTNERTLIKQLGSWLGLLTFAKNKPVLAKDMDLKQLIADAYTRGRMIAVLPFVEKVLSGCKDTKVRGAHLLV